MLNPFLMLAPHFLSWRKLPAIFHKDICGRGTQLTRHLLITSLDLSEGRGSQGEVLTSSDSSASQSQIPLHEDKTLSQTDLLNITGKQESTMQTGIRLPSKHYRTSVTLGQTQNTSTYVYISFLIITGNQRAKGISLASHKLKCWQLIFTRQPWEILWR